MAVIGIHGLKQRWADGTMREGLQRDSAAWFLATPPGWRAEAAATVSAAVYLALSSTTRAQLCEQDRPGAYTALFHAQPELLPCLLIFADQPTGHETVHRYMWLGSPVAVTARYTKVGRAGRRVSPRASDFSLLRLALDEVAEIERRVERADRPRPRHWRTDRDLIERVQADAACHPSHLPGLGTKMAQFCAASAQHLLPALAGSALARRATEVACERVA